MPAARCQRKPQLSSQKAADSCGDGAITRRLGRYQRNQKLCGPCQNHERQYNSWAKFLTLTPNNRPGNGNRGIVGDHGGLQGCSFCLMQELEGVLPPLRLAARRDTGVVGNDVPPQCVQKDSLAEWMAQQKSKLYTYH